jgi:hypothetical protein
MALPVQFDISAVLRLFASPRGRKSFMVADVIALWNRGYYLAVPAVPG